MTIRRELAALFALLAMALGFSGVAAAAPEKPDTVTAASQCTPRPISASEISAEYIRAVDGSFELSAYERVEFGFGLALAEGHCEGDSITFTPPAELGSNGSPVDLATDNGVVIAHAVYEDGKVSVTLTDAVEDPSKDSRTGGCPRRTPWSPGRPGTSSGKSTARSVGLPLKLPSARAASSPKHGHRSGGISPKPTQEPCW